MAGVTASVPPSVKLPEVVTVPERVKPLTVPVPLTDMTVPPPVPPPMSARNSAADRAVTVLSALIRINRTALGLVSVNRFEPTVVAPKLVRAPDVVVEPVPPRATDNVPVVPVMMPRPVQLVKVPEEGVPSGPPLANRVTVPAGIVAVVVPVVTSVNE